MSIFSFAAHSLQRLVRVSLAPGTQWSQNPTASLPAAKAPRTNGAAKAPVAAVCNSLRLVRVTFDNSASHDHRGASSRRGLGPAHVSLSLGFTLAEVELAIYSRMKPS